MVRAFLALVAIGVLAMGGLVGLQVALEDAGEDHEITNETWTPTAGSVTTLDESNRNGAYYDENVTVHDENDTEMNSGDDYLWNSGNGTVKALSGGDLDGDDNATISYGFAQTTQEQRRLTGMAAQIPRGFGFFVLLAPVLLLLLFVRGL